MEIKAQQEFLLNQLIKEESDKLHSEHFSGSLRELSKIHKGLVEEELARIFSVTFQILEKIDSQKLMTEFLKSYVPTSASLLEIPMSFFDFLKHHSLSSDIPLLSAMAKLELRREEARFIPSSKELSVEELLQKFAKSEVATLSLQAHVQVSTFELPVWTLWQWSKFCRDKELDASEQGECERLPIEEYQESVMSYRCNDEVRTVKVSRDEANFLRAMRAGKTIAELETQFGKGHRSFLETLLADGLLKID